MAALVLFGFNVLLIMGVWALLRRAIQDAYRDRLFDMRDEMRQWFLDHGYGLERREYAALRELLNSYIYMSHRMHFSGYMAFMSQVDGNKELQAEIDKRTEGMFVTHDDTIREKIDSVRFGAASVMLEYMVMKSPFVMAMVVVYGFCSLVRHLTWTVPGGVVRAAMSLCRQVDSIAVVEDFSLLGGARTAG